MESPRTLKNITQIASLGLCCKDLRIVKDLITLSRKFKNRFEYNAKSDLAEMDILFIDLENEKAMEFYANHGVNAHSEPIFVYQRSAGVDTPKVELPQYPNLKTLSTPIRIVELSELLQNIVSTPKVSIKPSVSLYKKKDCFKMLVVDDSFPVRKYLEEKLPMIMAEIGQNLDFDIQFAASGQDAVDKVKEARGAFDMVFLDIMMDDIDGYKICKWIKKVKRNINVVMLTSKKSPIDRLRANLSGSDNFLSKPPTDDDLKSVILKHRKFEKVDNVKSNLASILTT